MLVSTLSSGLTKVNKKTEKADKRDLAMLYPDPSLSLFSLPWALVFFSYHSQLREPIEKKVEKHPICPCFCIHIFISVTRMDCFAMWQCSNTFIFKWNIHRWAIFVIFCLLKCQEVKSIFLPFVPPFKIFSLISFFICPNCVGFA